MSTLLSAQAVSFDNAFGTLFHNITFSLQKGDRIGLLGANGSGKSTLQKILSGELDVSRGNIVQASHCLLARIEQHLPPSLAQATLLASVVAQLPPSLQLSERWRAEALLDSLGFSVDPQASVLWLYR
ncbi:ATP-binding cassette domain-containing protein [Pantoea sp.]|uniref:ATP-binding cassette domain-containing protein n=1 Tax=Pantoea sp. TaxID=69393 RepID=UPI00345BD170